MRQPGGSAIRHRTGAAVVNVAPTVMGRTSRVASARESCQQTPTPCVRSITRTKAASLAFTLAVLIAPLRAQQSPTPTPSLPAPSADSTSPAGVSGRVLQWGIEQRTRWENWNNIIDFNDAKDDQRNQVRFRNRFWLSVPVHRNVELFVGVANEFKKQSTPSIPFNGNELIFESLYLDLRKVLSPRLSVRVGRQDLFRGEGFLLADGTSGDGSRTGYFNAIDVASKVRQSGLELIGILDPKQDRFLPRLNDQRTYLTEWDEHALAVYYTDKNLKHTVGLSPWLTQSVKTLFAVR